MNITAMKAALNNKETVNKLRKAIYNTNKLCWPMDHVTNSKGNNFLAVRCQGGVLSIHDKNYKDVTQLVVKVCQDVIKSNEINQGDTFYYMGELYYNKYQVINKEVKNPSFICENVITPEDQQVFTKSKINELINK